MSSHPNPIIPGRNFSRTLDHVSTFYLNLCSWLLLCMCILNTRNPFFYVFVFAALVPLEEFREINFSKQYGLTNDPEVLEVLDAVSKTKGVLILFAFILYIYIFVMKVLLAVHSHGCDCMCWNRWRWWPRSTGGIQERSCAML